MSQDPFQDQFQSPKRNPDAAYLRHAAQEDARLQPDPELALSGGRASRTQIWAVTLGTLFVAGLVLYGISQPPRDSQTAAAPPSSVSSETTGAAPQQQDQNAAAQPQPKEQQQDQQKQPQQPQAAPEQPQQQQSKPGPSDSTRGQ